MATDTPGLGYMDLLRMLTGPVYSQTAALPHKQAYCSIAKCVAALTRACPTEGPAVVGQFIQVNPAAALQHVTHSDGFWDEGLGPLGCFILTGREEQSLH